MYIDTWLLFCGVLQDVRGVQCFSLNFASALCLRRGKSCLWMMKLLEESAIMISGAKRNHQCDCNLNHKHTHFLFCF